MVVKSRGVVDVDTGYWSISKELYFEPYNVGLNDPTIDRYNDTIFA